MPPRLLLFDGGAIIDLLILAPGAPSAENLMR